MLKTYPAIFHKEGTGYWVEFPEFGGGTEGKNIEEAMKNAREMLENVLASYIDEGMALPTPSDILKIEVSDGFVSMIQVDPAPFVRSNKAIRLGITISPLNKSASSQTSSTFCVEPIKIAAITKIL